MNSASMVGIIDLFSDAINNERRDTYYSDMMQVANNIVSGKPDLYNIGDILNRDVTSNWNDMYLTLVEVMIDKSESIDKSSKSYNKLMSIIYNYDYLTSIIEHEVEYLDGMFEEVGKTKNIITALIMKTLDEDVDISKYDIGEWYTVSNGTLTAWVDYANTLLMLRVGSYHTDDVIKVYSALVEAEREFGSGEGSYFRRQ